MDKNNKILLIVFGIVIAMGGLAFASIPLYDLFCRVTGFGGTTQVSEFVPEEVLERKITVRFNTDTSRRLPWDFEAETEKMEINIGQQGLINFIAQNRAARPITGTAVYNVTPLKAGKYFHKTQCFCFDEQELTPGQKMNMPVAFFIDPAITEDRSMEDLDTITLSYSFFKTETKELDEALEAFYNSQ
ncbi:MAG: cytochrome c oxidase assembly protein [Pseudomonadota bacterium]